LVSLPSGTVLKVGESTVLPTGQDTVLWSVRASEGFVLQIVEAGVGDSAGRKQQKIVYKLVLGVALDIEGGRQMFDTSKFCTPSLIFVARICVHGLNSEVTGVDTFQSRISVCGPHN
jgi:hypothetical protein